MAEEEDFTALLALLKESRGFDFTGYKRSSLQRRVQRRMEQLGIAGYGDYVDYLQVHPDEYAALFNTVLINVTGFFRDPDAWRQLRAEVVPRLLAGKKPTETIRVWSAGCATGEEAYSIAIVLAEELGVEDFRERVKIYATDVDDEALAVARQATYGEHDLRDVPPDLRDRYFEQSGQRYSFTKDLRRVLIFGRNDLTQDAPISRVDLLICRNTLMYFTAEMQARVLSRFHFALNSEGILFLGRAEMLLSHRQTFEPFDLKRRFFRKGRRDEPDLGILGSLRGDPVPRTPPRLDPGDLRTEALQSSPVATVVIAADGTVVGVNQRAEHLLSLSPRDVGRSFVDLDASYRPVELRPLLDETRRERRPIWVRNAPFTRGPTDKLYLDVQLVPLLGRSGAAVATAVFYSDVTRPHTLQSELEFANRQIETAYEELQSTVEELETTNEELQSTVEELETTNEELQSTNEELETMNEELQSTNDELQSINDELRERSDQLDGATEFLQSILRSLRTAVVVVDPDLVVRVWNRQAEDLWGLRTDEATGQHLLNLDIGLPTDQLRPLVRAVLAGEDQPGELALEGINRRGRPIGVRVLGAPLHSADGNPGGAIIVMDAVAAEP